MNTPLHVAPPSGNKAAISVLINCDHVDVNARNICGETTLLQAVKASHVSSAKLLAIHKDVNVNAVADYGITALSIAVRNDVKPPCRI